MKLSNHITFITHKTLFKARDAKLEPHLKSKVKREIRYVYVNNMAIFQLIHYCIFPYHKKDYVLIYSLIPIINKL